MPAPAYDVQLCFWDERPEQPAVLRGDAGVVVAGEHERGLDRSAAARTWLVQPAPEIAAHNANYTGSDISSGANTAKQIAVRPRFALHPYTLGVKRLSLLLRHPPGLGVHGRCGYDAAETALAKL